MKRRDFFKYVAIGAVGTTLSSSILSANSTLKVVVIGGGYSGRTVAKYLKMWGSSSVDVTIVDRDIRYTSPILSNLVLNGQKSISDLEFGYDSFTSKYGVSYINKDTTSIDRIAKKVIFNDGSSISYDKLILATGIEFKQVNSYDFTKVPHAWTAGEQTTILKSKIDTLVDGDTFLMSIPKAPYRCPPGPYERACVVADYLKNTKGLNINIIVLDENSDIVVEKDSFSLAFDRYGIDYRASSKVTYIDDETMSINYEQNGIAKNLTANLLNIIPNQKASKIVQSSGLCDSSGFASVDLKSYRSLIDSNIYVIGDSHKSSQPKAGHIANSEAKICADAIVRELNGYEIYSTPKTNSACYSPVSSSTATWLTAVYEYDSVTNDMKTVSFGSGSESSKNYSQMFLWAGNLFSDTFN